MRVHRTQTRRPYWALALLLPAVALAVAVMLVLVQAQAEAAASYASMALGPGPRDGGAGTGIGTGGKVVSGNGNASGTSSALAGLEGLAAPAAPAGLTGLAAPAAPATSRISAENALPGTDEWANIGNYNISSLSAFPGAVSVNAGDPINIHVKSTGSFLSARLYRLGYYQNHGARLVSTYSGISTSSPSLPAPVPAPQAWSVAPGHRPLRSTPTLPGSAAYSYCASTPTTASASSYISPSVTMLTTPTSW